MSDTKVVETKYGRVSGETKDMAGFLGYNPNIDRIEGGFSAGEVVDLRADLHRKTFPHKYDNQGRRIEE